MKKSKIFIGLILISIVFSSCTGKKSKPLNKKNKTDLTELKLNGPIKSLTEIQFNNDTNKLGEIHKKISDKHIYLFNESGYIIEDTIYSFDKTYGSLIERLINKYDGRGNQIEEYDYYTETNSTIKKIYKYNDKGNQIERDSYSSDTIFIGKETYKYDIKGNQIEWNFDGSDDSLSGKNIYKYNDKGDKIEWDWFSKGKLYLKYTFKYDDKENLIEVDTYRPDGSLRNKEISLYDKKGNEIELDKYKGDGRLETKYSCKINYDTKDNWIKSTSFKNGILSYYLDRIIIYY